MKQNRRAESRERKGAAAQAQPPAPRDVCMLDLDDFIESLDSVENSPCKQPVSLAPAGCKSLRSPLSALRSCTAFTLFETLIAIMLFVLLAGAVYKVSTAAIFATDAALDSQVEEERLDTFLAATRNAFSSLPAKGAVTLRYDTSGSAGTVEMVFSGTSSPYGIPVMGGGELILAARPQSDGTRAFSLMRVPRDTSTTDLGTLRSRGAWFPLLTRVEKVEWAVWQNGEWVSEWEGSIRPQLVRLRFISANTGDLIEVMLRVPPATEPTRPGRAAVEQTPTPTPEP